VPSPWTPFINYGDTVHYPVQRHDGTFNVLFCDAHAEGMVQNDLFMQRFYVRGP
jgi:prepilin-type processing-associated H-X9-DG protein